MVSDIQQPITDNNNLPKQKISQQISFPHKYSDCSTSEGKTPEGIN